ncbi:MAG: TRAP transporter substrate-binding protein DctP [Oscillibacter sp.]|nr:TRAP transporter substrate-binding protein DctP [Oscillibacter sp.]MEA4993744.1 TRAP transporter substrate-binding protein DctP [Oscillibacter sp.]
MMKKNTQKILASALAVCMSLTLLTACGGSGSGTDGGAGSGAPVADGKTYTWRLQSNYSLDSIQGDMAKQLKECVETATQGRLKVELYEPGALCQASDIITYLSQGAFDCAVIFGSTYSGVLPEADLGTGLPFAWESSAEIYDVMENYGLYDLIQEAYGELGIKYYWNAHEPNYNTLCNFEVHSVADYAGKKIRALGVWGDYYAAIGASPVNIPGTEVYQALQLGTIDGAHYGWSALSDSNNIREVVKYAIEPSLSHCQMATVVNQGSLDKLPDDLRNVVDETIYLANIGIIGQAHVVGTEKSVRDAVQGGYVELVQMDDDVVAELREIAITQVWEKLAAKSERMAKGIEIIKQQSRDYGRKVDY